MGSLISVLACDIGAGSGRVLQVGYCGRRIELKQVTRFGNASIKVGQSLYWDILGIFKGLKDGLAKASGQGPGDVVSMGIDTWGNDFSFIDKKGFMIENPFSYRDNRTENIVQYVDGIIPAYELFLRNGIQQVRMNTMYQLASLVKERPYVFDTADKFLFIPDLLTYFLTGDISNEYTLSTISQMYSYDKKDWDYELIDRLGIPSRLFSPIIRPGKRCGTILPSICSELNIKALPLTAVGAHDTASAVAAVPEPDERTIYISSGTWSIVGTETDAPVINENSFRYNFSNEGGVDGSIRLLKNVMGMWILQEIQRRFLIEGRNYTFEELSEMAASGSVSGPVIDPDDESFYEPTNMPCAIREYCRKTGQKVPETDAEIVLTALISLAFKYRFVVNRLEKLVGYSMKEIHIVGGGGQNRVLCQMTANCCNKVVCAGPTEATALGNAVTQLVSLGELSGMKDARRLIKQCFPPDEYYPEDREEWEENYNRFLKVTGL